MSLSTFFGSYRVGITIIIINVMYDIGSDTILSLESFTYDDLAFVI